jgi:two-component system OmpR family sensor kinase
MARSWISRRAATVAAVTVLLAGTGTTLAGMVPAEQAAPVLAVIAVAMVAMIAILAYVAGHLSGERRVRWLSPLAACYGVLTMAVVLNGEPGQRHATTAAAAVGLPAAGAVPMAAAMLLCCAVLVYGSALAGAGWVERNGALCCVGAGLAVVGVAHGYEELPHADSPARCLVFLAVRLVGAFVVLVGVVRRTAKAIQTMHLERHTQQEELRLAQLGLRQAAERDHEVRNAVAGLAGATSLIGAQSEQDDAAALHGAVAAELARLDALLRGHPDRAAEPKEYRVLPVLHQQVALRRSTGMDIEVNAELGLGVAGSSTVLAQVLTNVLSNCAAHAAGSPVRIAACARDGKVLIRVADLGPGVAVERGRDVFDSGVRGACSQGQGFGLAISRRLLEAEGATISIRPRSVSQPGCTVLLELPAARVTPSVPANVIMMESA